MKIGILSDTHDQVARTTKALQVLLAEGAEAIVHCGDLTRPEIVRIFAKVPTYFVFGNNDYDHDGLLRAMVRPTAVSLGRGGEIELAGTRTSRPTTATDRPAGSIPERSTARRVGRSRFWISTPTS